MLDKSVFSCKTAIMYLVANWKMEGSRNFAKEHISQIANIAEINTILEQNTLILCPPAIWLCDAASLLKDTQIAPGGQDCHSHKSGAFTGDIAASMLKEAGCDYVILGHSERRAQHGETNNDVAQKVVHAYDTGLQPIICVGETLDQRENGECYNIIKRQLSNVFQQIQNKDNQLIIAYEPIWAIGSGKIPQNDDIAQVSEYIHNLCSDAGFSKTAVLYGGSVNSTNCHDIFAVATIDGVLVGGASLDLQQWTAIMQAATTL